MALAIELANTIHLRHGEARDGLATAADLAAWLRNASSSLATPLTAAHLSSIDNKQLVRARRLRDAIRSVADAMTAGQPTSPADVESINALVRGAPMWRELRGQRRLRAVPEHGGPPVVAALAEIAQGAVDLLTGAEVQRCHAPRCILFFVKTHPRQEWCSDACGNRMRAARHYARVRQRRMAAET